jgi:hypothetical protein
MALGQPLKGPQPSNQRHNRMWHAHTFKHHSPLLQLARQAGMAPLKTWLTKHIHGPWTAAQGTATQQPEAQPNVARTHF